MATIINAIDESKISDDQKKSVVVSSAASTSSPPDLKSSNDGLQITKKESANHDDNVLESETEEVTELWPIICIPERNPLHISREERLKAISDLVLDESKLRCCAKEARPHYVCIASEDQATGKSEIVIELAHRLQTVGKFQFMGYVPSLEEPTVRLCFQRMRSRIEQSDPTFCFCGLPESAAAMAPANRSGSVNGGINDEGGDVSTVIHWLEDLPVPWLLILDGVDDMASLASRRLPIRCTAPAEGVVLLVGRLTELALRSGEECGWEHLDPKLVTPGAVCPVRLGGLAEEEVLLTAERALGKVLLTDQMDDMIRLAVTLDLQPAPVLHAIVLLKQMNTWNHAAHAGMGEQQLEDDREDDRMIGPRDYLGWMEEVQSMVDASLQYVTPSFFSSNASPSVVAAVTSFVTSLHVAGNMPHSRIWAMRRSLELMVFLSPAQMDMSIIEKWLLPPCTALTVRVLSKWRLGEFVGGDKLPPQEAEFEVGCSYVMDFLILVTLFLCCSWK